VQFWRAEFAEKFRGRPMKEKKSEAQIQISIPCVLFANAEIASANHALSDLFSASNELRSLCVCIISRGSQP
jgi:hypothetical protein